MQCFSTLAILRGVDFCQNSLSSQEPRARFTQELLIGKIPNHKFSRASASQKKNRFGGDLQSTARTQ